MPCGWVSKVLSRMNRNSRRYPDRPVVGVGTVVLRRDSVVLVEHGRGERG